MVGVVKYTCSCIIGVLKVAMGAKLSPLVQHNFIAEGIKVLLFFLAKGCASVTGFQTSKKRNTEPSTKHYQTRESNSEFCQ